MQSYQVLMTMYISFNISHHLPRALLSNRRSTSLRVSSLFFIRPLMVECDYHILYVGARLCKIYGILFYFTLLLPCYRLLHPLLHHIVSSFSGRSIIFLSLHPHLSMHSPRHTQLMWLFVRIHRWL